MYQLGARAVEVSPRPTYPQGHSPGVWADAMKAGYCRTRWAGVRRRSGGQNGHDADRQQRLGDHEDHGDNRHRGDRRDPQPLGQDRRRLSSSRSGGSVPAQTYQWVSVRGPEARTYTSS